MNLTHEQYRAAKKNKTFTHQNVWDIVKGAPTMGSNTIGGTYQNSESNAYTTTSSDTNFTSGEGIQEPKRPQRKGKKPVSVSKDDPFWDEFKAFQQKIP